MGTITAQILIGSVHQNHGGIQPNYKLLLSENSRPCWVLSPENGTRSGRSSQIKWIPTVEKMLEDAFLMVAVHVLKNKEIVESAGEFCKSSSLESLELYEDFSEQQREELYAKCRHIKDFPKFIISVFKGSTIEGQLKVIESYQMNIEVCKSVFCREFSNWTNSVQVFGSLVKEP